MTGDDHEALVAGQADMRATIRELRAEIERHMREKVVLAGLVAKERDDNERLVAALVDIADYYVREFSEGEKAYQAVIVARRALEPKP